MEWFRGKVVKDLGRTCDLIYGQPLNLASWGYIHLAQAAGFGCIISSEFWNVFQPINLLCDGRPRYDLYVYTMYMYTQFGKIISSFDKHSYFDAHTIFARNFFFIKHFKGWIEKCRCIGIIFQNQFHPIVFSLLTAHKKAQFRTK